MSDGVIVVCEIGEEPIHTSVHGKVSFEGVHTNVEPEESDEDDLVKT